MVLHTLVKSNTQAVKWSEKVLKMLKKSSVSGVIDRNIMWAQVNEIQRSLSECVADVSEKTDIQWQRYLLCFILNVYHDFGFDCILFVFHFK